VIALALLLTFVGNVGVGANTTSVAFAQDATAVPNVGAQTTPVQTSQPVDDNSNDFPWGILGLLGLAGLAGLRRPEPVRHEPGRVTPTVGVYDSKK
jgi:MYXO-CTERM domain-containing protein